MNSTPTASHPDHPGTHDDPPTQLLPQAQLRRLWRLQLTLPPLALLLLALGALVFRPYSIGHSLPLALLGAALCALAWYYAGQRHARYRIRLQPVQGVVVERGVWWREQIWLPIARLQHLDVVQGPLERRWSMATLVLHTAGSHKHETRLPGLKLAEAQALRDALLPQLRQHHHG